MNSRGTNGSSRPSSRECTLMRTYISWMVFVIYAIYLLLCSAFLVKIKQEPKCVYFCFIISSFACVWTQFNSSEIVQKFGYLAFAQDHEDDACV